MLIFAIGTEEEIKATSLTNVSQMSIEHSQISNPNIEGDINVAITTILGAGPNALVIKRGIDGADIYTKDGERYSCLSFSLLMSIIHLVLETHLQAVLYMVY